MNWASLFPLNIIPKGDGKQSGFTKIKNEIDRIYTILSGTNNGGKISVSAIENVSTGNIVSTDLQTAINEISNNLPLGRNKIINGDMLIDQRNSGAAQSFTASAAIAYCVNRWYASCTGANITGQQIAGTGVYSKSYRFTGLTGNMGTLFGQRIESVNCRDLLNNDVTIQAEISSSSITSVTWTAYYANSTDTFSAKTQIATGTLKITSIPTIYNFNFNAGSNARNGICIEFTTGALFAAQSLTYSGIQLEKGNVATPFEVLDYEDILGKCQRYYEVGDLFVQGYSNGVSAIGGTYCYKIEKRVTPTVTQTTNGSSSITSYNAVTSTKYSYGINASCSGAGAAYFDITIYANAEL